MVLSAAPALRQGLLLLVAGLAHRCAAPTEAAAASMTDALHPELGLALSYPSSWQVDATQWALVLSPPHGDDALRGTSIVIQALPPHPTVEQSLRAAYASLPSDAEPQWAPHSVQPIAGRWALRYELRFMHLGGEYVRVGFVFAHGGGWLDVAQTSPTATAGGGFLALDTVLAGL